jgi:hypothetical protein
LEIGASSPQPVTLRFGGNQEKIAQVEGALLNAQTFFNVADRQACDRGRIVGRIRGVPSEFQ